MDSYLQKLEKLLISLGSDVQLGLASAEAKKRLDANGHNELAAEVAETFWKKLLAPFADALVILLLIASATSAAMWLWERDSALPYESIAILAVVILNAVIGYVQVARAESALAALRQMAAPTAKVVRDGQRRTIPSSEIVVGDLIVIEEGDIIPADARVVASTSLQVAEASLTGESLPVAKAPGDLSNEVSIGDRTNMVYSGTNATYGHGLALVTSIGMQTEMGRIAGLLASATREQTPLQKELNRVGKTLGMVVIGIAIFMIATILLLEEIKTFSALFEVLLLGVALAVAAVPEGLPAMVTTVLAMGVQRMAKRHAIVRHLAAVETLGSATIIASDKTGTLTKNEMSVRAVITASGRIHFDGTGYQPQGRVSVAGGQEITVETQPADSSSRHSYELDQIMTVADRANNAVLQETNGNWTVHGDPTEGALLVAARKAGIDSASLETRYAKVGELPFSSDRKRMTTFLIDADNDHRLVGFTKGAPGVVLKLCRYEQVGDEQRELSDERRLEILRSAEELAGEALRTLAIACRDHPRDALEKQAPHDGLEHELLFLGLIGMMDPPREEAREAVKLAKQAGIRPIMITGDHPKTASVIAIQLGIAPDGRVVIGEELDKQSESQLAAMVHDVSIYARVNPEQKLRIVRALQSSGEVVAMTGDGVNDAPALKTADIGIAMGITGTDVSKEASDIILADDNYATIVAAVEEGRAIYDNIRKFLRYLLSSNIGEVMSMFLGVLFAKAIGLETEESTLVLPLLATQILWINLVTDGAPALALGMDPAETDLMVRPPRPQSEGVITRAMWIGIFLIGAIMAVGTLLVLDASLPGGFIEGTGSMKYAQTRAFTTLVLFQLFHVFNARSEVNSAFHGLFRNGLLWGSLAISLLLQVAVIYVPSLQTAFSTTSLNLSDWIFCAAVASSVVWLREVHKFFLRWLCK